MLKQFSLVPYIKALTPFPITEGPFARQPVLDGTAMSVRWRVLLSVGAALTAGVSVAGAQTVWDLLTYLKASPLPAGFGLWQTVRFFSVPLWTAALAALLLGLAALAATLAWRRKTVPGVVGVAFVGASAALLAGALAAIGARPRFAPTHWQLAGVAAIGLVSIAFLLVHRRWSARRVSWPAGAAVIGTLAATLTGPLLLGVWLFPDASAAARRSLRPTVPVARPNIVLIVLDTTRADALAAYGAPLGSTPAIEQLASAGEVYLDAVATSSWTLPSHASMFTGLLPSAHGATYATWQLTPGIETLAGGLGSLGYDTAGFSANPLVSGATGLDRGFDHFRELWRLDWTGPFLIERLRAAARTVAGHPALAPSEPDATRETSEAIEWIAARQRPYFLFINYFEPHGSYDPPEPYRSVALAALDLSPGEKSTVVRLVGESGLADLPLRYLTGGLAWSSREVEILRALYRAEIAFVDAEVGRLLAAVEAGAGNDRETLVVITADHGEEFGEHGRVGHHYSLHRQLIHVPLIVLDPRRAERGRHDRKEVVSQRNLYGYLLQAAQGRPWPTAGLAGADERRRTWAFAELDPPNDLIERFTADDPSLDRELFHRSFWVARQGRWKLLWAPPEDPELFDVVADPEETSDCAAGEPDRVAVGLRRLEQEGCFEPATSGEGPGLDEETRRHLKALGYL